MQIPFIGRFYENPAMTTAKPVAEPRRPRIGLALGAGAARGWSHIGVLQELMAHGIIPDVIAGTSVGAVVGGCHSAGRLNELETFARSLTPRRMFSLMDFAFSGAGLLGGGKLKTLLDKELPDVMIESLPVRFGAVATEIGSGHEVWLTHGHLCDTIRASYALPGIFEPIKFGERWLFDGALVNPLPVTLCRAMGADVVIAVSLVSDALSRASVVSDALNGAPATEPGRNAEARQAGNGFSQKFSRSVDGAPSMANAMMEAFSIMQDRVARSRLAGDPPDVLIRARIGKIGLFDFHRADELIAIGKEAARGAIEAIVHETGVGVLPAKAMAL